MNLSPNTISFLAPMTVLSYCQSKCGLKSRVECLGVREGADTEFITQQFLTQQQKMRFFV